MPTKWAGIHWKRWNWIFCFSGKYLIAYETNDNRAANCELWGFCSVACVFLFCAFSWLSWHGNSILNGQKWTKRKHFFWMTLLYLRQSHKCTQAHISQCGQTHNMRFIDNFCVRTFSSSSFLFISKTASFALQFQFEFCLIVSCCSPYDGWCVMKYTHDYRM